MPYYSDLSADSSSGDDDDDGFSEASDHNHPLPPSQIEITGREGAASVHHQDAENDDDRTRDAHQQQLQSCILHLDLDCFYCACEELDRKLPKSRPLAIGQKHIIVTCNYEARRWGVKKLQLREDARKACPHILIVEGSDLERYRRHARNVYEVFRKCIQEECDKHFILCRENSSSQQIPAVRRGRGMDEMQADLSFLVDALFSQRNDDSEDITNNDKPDSSVYVYGEEKRTTILTEDQTGAQATVEPYKVFGRKNQSKNSCHDEKNCQRKLMIAAQKFGRFIQQTIFDRTGFTTTLGISTSPLLAKLATDLNKPMSLNVLFPWRSSSLIASMPLRKIPDAGRRTIQLLNPALEKFHGAKKAPTSFWTCQDLLELPWSEIRSCLGKVKSNEQECEQQCSMLLQRCRGFDTSVILDDQGCAQKTISVENSFRRGTVLNPEAVWKGLEDLYIRLPRLLKDRRDWSRDPSKAYPTTIKLTARVVDRTLVATRRRPFVTKSKQVPFPAGRELLEEADVNRQQFIVRQAIKPLVYALVLNSTGGSYLNVTRLNIAVTNFQDVCKDPTEGPPAAVSMNSPKGSQQQPLSIRDYCSQQWTQTTEKPTGGKTKADSCFKMSKTSVNRSYCYSASKKRGNSSPKMSKLVASPAGVGSSYKKRPKLDNHDNQSSREEKYHNGTRLSPPPSRSSQSGAPPSSCAIDPAVLAELPASMVQEVIRDYHQAMSATQQSKTKAKPSQIDHFFSRRK